MHPVGAGLCSAQSKTAENLPIPRPPHIVDFKNVRRRLKNPAFPGVFASYPFALKMFSPFDTFHASFFFIMR